MLHCNLMLTALGCSVRGMERNVEWYREWSLFKKQHRYFIIYAMPCLSSTAWTVCTLIEGILLFAYA